MRTILDSAASKAQSKEAEPAMAAGREPGGTVPGPTEIREAISERSRHENGNGDVEARDPLESRADERHDAVRGADGRCWGAHRAKA